MAAETKTPAPAVLTGPQGRLAKCLNAADVWISKKDFSDLDFASSLPALLKTNTTVQELGM